MIVSHLSLIGCASTAFDNRIHTINIKATEIVENDNGAYTQTSRVIFEDPLGIISEYVANTNLIGLTCANKTCSRTTVLSDQIQDQTTNLFFYFETDGAITGVAGNGNVGLSPIEISCDGQPCASSVTSNNGLNLSVSGSSNNQYSLKVTRMMTNQTIKVDSFEGIDEVQRRFFKSF